MKSSWIVLGVFFCLTTKASFAEPRLFELTAPMLKGAVWSSSSRYDLTDEGETFYDYSRWSGDYLDRVKLVLSNGNELLWMSRYSDETSALSALKDFTDLLRRVQRNEISCDSGGHANRPSVMVLVNQGVIEKWDDAYEDLGRRLCSGH